MKKNLRCIEGNEALGWPHISREAAAFSRGSVGLKPVSVEGVFGKCRKLQQISVRKVAQSA